MFPANSPELVHADGCVFGANCVGAKGDGTASGICTPFVEVTTTTQVHGVLHA